MHQAWREATSSSGDGRRGRRHGPAAWPSEHAYRRPEGYREAQHLPGRNRRKTAPGAEPLRRRPGRYATGAQRVSRAVRAAHRRPFVGRIVAERAMGVRKVGVREVTGQDAAQVAFGEDEDVMRRRRGVVRFISSVPHA